MNQNAHDVPSHPGVAPASFADHKLRINSRIVRFSELSAGSTRVRNRKSLLADFCQRQNKRARRSDAFCNLRIYKLIREQTAVIDLLMSVTKNVTLIRCSQSEL